MGAVGHFAMHQAGAGANAGLYLRDDDRHEKTRRGSGDTVSRRCERLAYIRLAKPILPVRVVIEPASISRLIVQDRFRTQCGVAAGGYSRFLTHNSTPASARRGDTRRRMKFRFPYRILHPAFRLVSPRPAKTNCLKRKAPRLGPFVVSSGSFLPVSYDVAVLGSLFMPVSPVGSHGLAPLKLRSASASRLSVPVPGCPSSSTLWAVGCALPRAGFTLWRILHQ